MSFPMPPTTMAVPRSERVAQEVIHEMATIIFEMQPSETYLNLTQTLLNNIVTIGDDYIIAPELGVLLGPAKPYIKFQGGPTYTVPQQHQGIQEMDGGDVPFSKNSTRDGDDGDDGDDENDDNDDSSESPMPTVKPMDDADSANFEEDAFEESATEEPAFEDAGFASDDQTVVGTESFPEQDASSIYAEPEQSSHSQRIVFLNYEERMQVVRADVVNHYAFELVFKRELEDESFFVKERRAYDAVWTSGWADQPKHVKSRQLTTDGGKAFFQYGKE